MKTSLYSLFLFGVVSLFFASCEKTGDSNDDNNPPVAEFTITPQTGDTSVTFLFDASASYDPEQGADSLLYSWDFTGYHNWTQFSSNRVASHKYSEAGTYEVTLQVKDNKGWTDSKSHTLTVTY
jgi:PKD repeat protein